MRSLFFDSTRRPRLGASAGQHCAGRGSERRVTAPAAPPIDSEPTAEPHEPVLHRGLVTTTVLAALILLFFDIGCYRTFGKHEGYAVVCAREMIESGDWVVPRFGGVPRLEKPPMAYWAVAASARLFGELNETTARLPAAVSSLFLAGLIGLWGARWHGRVAGFGAAVAFVSSMLVLTYARRAEVDMVLCLMNTAAMFLIADQPESERGGKAFARWTGIYALLALAWLTKFHYGPVMVLAPALCFAVAQRRWRMIWHALNPLGLAMMVAAMTVWSSLVAARVPEAAAVWQEQTLGRVSGDLGREPVWFYCLAILTVPLPWTPLILLAAPESFRQAWRGLIDGLRRTRQAPRSRVARELFEVWSDSARHDDARQRFLWIWLVAQFAILTSMAAKHGHYLAATLPMLALLAGRGIARTAERLRRGAFEIGRPLALGAIATVLALTLGGLVVGGERWPEHAGMCRLIAGLIATGSVAGIGLAHVGKLVPAAMTVIVAFVVCSMLTTAHMVPADDYRRPAADFARSIRDEAGDRETLLAYRFGPDPIFHYLGHPSRRIESPEEVDRILRDHRSVRLVAPEATLPDLENLGDVHIIRRSTPPREKMSHTPPTLVEVEVMERAPRPPSMKTDARFARDPAK